MKVGHLRPRSRLCAARMQLSVHSDLVLTASYAVRTIAARARGSKRARLKIWVEGWRISVATGGEFNRDEPVRQIHIPLE